MTVKWNPKQGETYNELGREEGVVGEHISGEGYGRQLPLVRRLEESAVKDGRPGESESGTTGCRSQDLGKEGAGVRV